MRKMKVLLSALALIIATLTPMATFAEEAQTDTTKSNSIELNKEYGSEYNLVIPAFTYKLEDSLEFEVSATALLSYGKELNVSVESKYNWQLRDKNQANTNGIKYCMKYGDTAIKTKSANILTVAPGQKENKVKLTVSDIAEPNYAGVYQDTLTFTATPTDVTSTTPEDETTTTTDEIITTTTTTTTDETTTTTTTTVTNETPTVPTTET